MKREELKEKLSRVLKDEESLWRTRAKQHWLREGDGNAKFFHSIANGRRRANMIDSIDEDGVVYRSEEDKKNYFYLKFKELFTPDKMAPSSFGDWSGFFNLKRVSISKVDQVTRPFSLDEIKQAVFQLGSDKASIIVD